MLLVPHGLSLLLFQFDDLLHIGQEDGEIRFLSSVGPNLMGHGGHLGYLFHQRLRNLDQFLIGVLYLPEVGRLKTVRIGRQGASLKLFQKVSNLRRSGFLMTYAGQQGQLISAIFRSPLGNVCFLVPVQQGHG